MIIILFIAIIAEIFCFHKFWSSVEKLIKQRDNDDKVEFNIVSCEWYCAGFIISLIIVLWILEN